MDDETFDPRDPAPTPRRGLWILLLVLAVGWTAYLAFFSPSTRRIRLEPPLLSEPGRGRADFGWNVVDLDGRPVDLARYRGKALVLNVWATWCPPCVAEMPAIEQLAANPRINEKDVAVVAVSVDDEPAAVRRFVAERELRAVRVLRAAGPPPAAFATDAVPTTYLIAPDGHIAVSQIGAAQWDHPSVVTFLERLTVRGAIAQRPIPSQ